MDEELEPALKRAKITSSPTPDTNVWTQWHENLRRLQTKLLTGCFCNEVTLQLQRPPIPSNLESVADFREEYVLQFISTLELLISVALKQHSKEFICRKILHAAEDASSDVCIWELLLESLNSRDRFISFAASKALTKFLLWTKLPKPDLEAFFHDLFNQILSDSSDSTPQKLSNLLDTIRGVIDYKEEEDHPLETGLNDGTHAAPKPCQKVEIDTDFEDVKTLCVEALENSWTRLITKFHKILTNYQDKYEASTITFLSLWQSIVSVKTNLSVIATKNFHLQLQSFVPHLNSSLPAVLWKKILDLFSEILCYGSTLSLQDCLADEPCDLAHLILRCVKNRQFLQGVPYTKTYTGFGGHEVGNVDWEWKSGSLIMSQTVPSSSRASSSSANLPGPSRGLQFAGSSTSNLARKPAKRPNLTQEPNTAQVSATIVIGGPTAEETVEAEDIYTDTGGDTVLLQKLVLVVLKSVAVTVKETREDSDSEEEPSDSGSDSDGNDMLIIEKSIREVFQQLDSFIKSLLPYHPGTPLGEWIVKLFSDQDDALVEAMLCALDIFTGFHGRVEITSTYLKTALDPVTTFNAFAATVSQDKDVLLDLLMSNETCFLLYFLRYLKFCWKNWDAFVASCGRDFEKVIGLLIRLRMSVGKLVEKSLFPYNINPVLRLLERCEEMYESSCEAK